MAPDAVALLDGLAAGDMLRDALSRIIADAIAER